MQTLLYPVHPVQKPILTVCHDLLTVRLKRKVVVEFPCQEFELLLMFTKG